MNEHFVSAFQQVGQFQVTNEVRSNNSKASPQLRKRGGNLVSYFCTPDGQVLHFLVGPSRAHAVLEAADWVLAQQRAADALGDGGAAGRTELYRQAHTTAITADLRDAMATVRGQSKLPDPLSVSQLIRMAEDAKLALWPVRFKITPKTVAHHRAVARNSLTSQLPHVILSHLPLAKLDEISKPVFEILAGQTYNPYGERNERLAEEVKASFAAGTPTLLLVEPQIDLIGLPGEPEVQSSLPQSRTVERHLKSMRVVSLSRLELTSLLADLKLPAVSAKQGTEIKYLILDARGQQVAALSDKIPASVLARFMARAIAAGG